MIQDIHLFGLEFSPLLLVFAFFAGFIDAIAGGGGLVQLPSLMLLGPAADLPVLLGTNKLSSICGTSGALLRYSQSLKFNWKLLGSCALVAFCFSGLGAMTVGHLPSLWLKPLVCLLLLGVFLFTFWKPNFGTEKTRELKLLPSLLLSSLIGFYDGFFGPGTGSFLIFALVSFGGLNLLEASASSKIINWGTNLAALIIFALKSQLLIVLGLIMGLANLAGGLTGAQLAIKRGVPFIRNLYRLVVFALLLRIVWDQLKNLL